MPTGIYQRTEYHNNISRNNGFKKGDEKLIGNKFKQGKKSWNSGTKGVCKSNSGSFKKGNVLPRDIIETIKLKNTGQKRSKDCVNKLRERGKTQHHPTGEKSNNWKGGISFIKGYSNNFIKKKKEKLAGRPRPEYCEICNTSGKICFDHDHITGNFRGWICEKCNLALGLMRDNKETLIKMIKYLEKCNEL